MSLKIQTITTTIISQQNNLHVSINKQHYGKTLSSTPNQYILRTDKCM